MLDSVMVRYFVNISRPFTCYFDTFFAVIPRKVLKSVKYRNFFAKYFVSPKIGLTFAVQLRHKCSVASLKSRAVGQC